MKSRILNKGVIGRQISDWILPIISSVLLAFIWQPWKHLSFATLAILAINFSIVASLLWWADGYEREPIHTVLWSIAWGASPAIMIALILSHASTPLMIAAMIEEFAKLLGVYLVFRRGSIHSATDTLVIGGYVGLGFTIFEDFAYSVGDQQPIEVLIYRGIFSVFAHALFSGVGAAIMYLLWKRFEISGIILGFICSYIFHFIWNLSLTIDLASISVIMYFIIYAFSPPIALYLTCRFVRKREMRDIEGRGVEVIQRGIVTEENLQLILNRSLRREALRELSSNAKRKELKQQLQRDARRILESDRILEPSEDFDFQEPGKPDDPWA